jgi:acetolactate decarboxylase
LKEVTKNQPEFDMKNISGTIVGFRCPPFVKGINVPGYHLHFLSNDKSKGGHVLEFELSDGELELDVLNRYILQLPKETEDFAHTDLSKDRGRELEDVEHSNRVNSEQ